MEGQVLTYSSIVTARPWKEVISISDWLNSGSADRDEGLHICPACGSHLVQPSGEWELFRNTGLRLWAVGLWCPECGWYDTKLCNDRDAKRFEEVLDEGRETMNEGLEDVECIHLNELVDPFATALAEGLITAEDFR